MSDRPCNFCNFKKLEERVALEHAKLVKKKNPFGNFKDGVDIFVVDKEGKKEWLVWYMKLGSRCEC